MLISSTLQKSKINKHGNNTNYKGFTKNIAHINSTNRKGGGNGGPEGRCKNYLSSAAGNNGAMCKGVQYSVYSFAEE